MKWLLYAVSVVTILIGIVILAGGGFIFQDIAGSIFILVGTTSFGFAVIAGKLDALAKRTDGNHL